MGNQPPGGSLVNAVVEGDVLKVRDELASSKVDVNGIRDADGKALLELAVAGRNAAVAQCLLVAGANPQIVNQFQNTPLHTAAGTGEADLIELLLQYNASPNVMNIDGMTPLDCCLHWQKTQPAQASNWKQVRAIQLIKERGGYAAKFSAEPMAVTSAIPFAQSHVVPVVAAAPQHEQQQVGAIPVKY